MPDGYGFDHLPHRGKLMHSCIECGWPGWGVIVSEADRERHHLGHVREAKRAAEKRQRENLALARKTKAQQERENALAYSEGE